jgi:hypothetical protein
MLPEHDPPASREDVSNHKEITMFTKHQNPLRRSSMGCRPMFRTTTLLALSLAGCITASGVVFAHPEMDRYGRDITSGPWSVESKPIVADTDSTTDAAGFIIPETTQSTDVIMQCGRRLFDDCSPKTGQAKRQGSVLNFGDRDGRY